MSKLNTPNKHESTIHAKFALRLPLLPFKSFYTTEEMESLMQQPIIEEAFYIASPDLHNTYKRYQSGKLHNQQELEKMWIALHKYFTRMSTRPTPFGLFAGTAVGQWAEKTSIPIQKVTSIRKETRFDMDFVLDVANKLEQVREIRIQLKYSLNQSVHIANNYINYIEFEYDKSKRVYKSSQIDPNPYLEVVINKLEQPLPYQTLSRLLRDFDSSLAIEEVEVFLDELIKEQLIFSELQPSVVGSLPWDHIHETLMRLDLTDPDAKTVRDEVNELQKAIEQFNVKQETTISQYEALTSRAQQVIPKTKTNRLVQVDSFLPNAKYTLDIDIKHQLQEAHDILLHFAHGFKNRNLVEFAKIFTERYGSGEMPLLHVLDTNLGIGYPAKKVKDYAPFLEDLKLWKQGSKSGERKKNSISWSKSQDLLLKALTNSLKDNSGIIDLAEQDISWEKNQELLGSDTFQALFSIVGYDTETEKHQLVIHAMGGGSAINLISRFAISDMATNEVLQELVEFEKEQKPDGVVAEIAHLAEDRLGNVILRPSMRDYEIPFFARSLDEKKRLPLSDLTISIDQASQEVILRSKKLECKVYPRLSNAHNYSDSEQPPYRFLCELQNQGLLTYLNFRWGSLEGILKKLPRVVYKDIVLSKATWNLEYKDYQELLSEISEKNWKLWLKKWELPERFLLADRDNELLVDVGSQISIKAFIATLKKRRNVVLKEFLFNDTCKIIDEQSNPFVNQFIAFFKKAETEKHEKRLQNDKQQSTHKFKLSKTIKTHFPIGVEWLYLKLYCNPNNADRILRSGVMPVANELLEKGLIDSWFFLRFADPEHHLRLRLHVTHQQQVGEAFEIINKGFSSLRQHGMILTLSIDSYEREVERYWGNSVLDCEQIFYHDSQAILRLLTLIEENQDESLRWQYSALIMDRYLELANFHDLSEKIDFTKRNVDYFGREIGLNKNLKRQLDIKYRNLKEGFERLRKLNQLSYLDKDISKFALDTAPIFNKIIRDNESKRTKTDLSFLLASFVHMSSNRIWPVRGRFHEFIMYYLMHKDYKSIKARSKYDKSFEVR